MKTSTYLTSLVYMMVQAVFFGFGTLCILLTPLSAHANTLFPIMIALTILVSVPVARAVGLKLLRENPDQRKPSPLRVNRAKGQPA